MELLHLVLLLLTLWIHLQLLQMLSCCPSIPTAATPAEAELSCASTAALSGTAGPVAAGADALSVEPAAGAAVGPGAAESGVSERTMPAGVSEECHT